MEKSKIVKQLKLLSDTLLDMNRANIVSNPSKAILDRCAYLQSKMDEFRARKYCAGKSSTLNPEERKKYRDIANRVELFGKVSFKDGCLCTFSCLTVNTMSILYGVKLEWKVLDEISYAIFYAKLREKGIVGLEIEGPQYFAEHSVMIIADHANYVSVESFPYDREIYVRYLNDSGLMELINRYLVFLEYGDVKQWNSATNNRDILSILYPSKIEPYKLKVRVGTPACKPNLNTESIISNGMSIMDMGLKTTQKLKLLDPLLQERSSLAGVVMSSIKYGR